MSEKKYQHLVGRSASYREPFKEKKVGLISEITPVYSIKGTEYIATMEDGDTIGLSQCSFKEPIS